VADRKAQFDLVNQIGALLNHMSWAVDAILGVRDGARERAAKLPAKLSATDALGGKLGKLADAADVIRAKIVATKEGGAITGEERLREFVAGLYGDVSNYEGRPTQAQFARAAALARELEDVIREFTALTEAQLSTLNRELQAEKLPPLTVLSEKDWK
jgi:hypothetical protein